MKRNIILAAFAGSSILVGGCLSVLPDPKPPAIIYRLDTDFVAVVPDADAKIFRIDRPTAPSSLIRDDIIVSPDGRTLAVAENASWAQTIPDLVQGSLMKALATRSDLIGVLPTSGARTSHRVHLTIQNFEAVFDNGIDNAPIAKVQYLATVSDAGTRNLLGTLTVSKSDRAGSNAVTDIVQAQDTANQAAMTEISDWLTTLEIEATRS